MNRWASAVVSLTGGRIEAFEDVLAFSFGHRGEERERHPAGAGRFVDPQLRSLPIPIRPICGENYVDPKWCARIPRSEAWRGTPPRSN